MTEKKLKKTAARAHDGWLILEPEPKSFEELLGLQRIRLCVEGDAHAPVICTRVA